MDGGHRNPDYLFLSPVPNAVTSLGIQDQTNSSITLSWKAPLGPGHPPYTYCVSWIEEGSFVFKTHNTTDNNITLKELEAGSMYTFSVQAERNGVISDKGSLTGATGETQSSSGPSTVGMGKTVLGGCWELPGR